MIAFCELNYPKKETKGRLEVAIYFGKFDILPRINPKTLKSQSLVAMGSYQACDRLRHFEVSAQAAYIAGDLLEVRGKGKIHDYSKKGGVQFSKIYLPDQAPDQFADREKLWNAAELAEKRKDAQLCRTFIGALPRELSLAENIELLTDYIQTNFVDHGMIVDCAIHDPDYRNDNPHVHLMITMRDVTPDGFGNKNRNWNHKDILKSWRADWARVQNQALERAGFDLEEVGVDHRSYKEQGSGLKPQIHEGKDATGLRRKGILTEVAKYNEEVKAHNMAYTKEIEQAKAELAEDYNRKISSLYQTLSQSMIEPTLQVVDKEQSEVVTPMKILYDANDPKREQEVGVEPAVIAEGEPNEPGILSKLQDLKSAYLQKEYVRLSHEDLLKSAVREIQTVRSQQDDLVERMEAITEFRQELSEIASQEKELGLFDIFGKRKLEERSKRVAKALDQSIQALGNDYGITPDKVASVMARNHKILTKYSQDQNAAAKRLSAIARDKDKILSTYQGLIDQNTNLPPVPELHSWEEYSEMEVTAKLTIQQTEELFASFQKAQDQDQENEQSQGMDMEI